MIGVFSCPVAPVPACSWGLGGSCGLRQSASRHVPGLIPFSPGHSSLRPRSLELARSPQRPQFRPIQIKELRADESSSWIAALATEGNKLSPARSQKRYRAFVQSAQTVSARQAWQWCECFMHPIVILCQSPNVLNSRSDARLQLHAHLP